MLQRAIYKTSVSQIGLSPGISKDTRLKCWCDSLRAEDLVISERTGIGTRPPLKIQSRMSDGISVVATGDRARARTEGWKMQIQTE